MEVEPRRLEVLGDQASEMFANGECSLNDAVATVVGRGKLGSDHVKRVVEFANNKAFGRLFKNTKANSRLVNFAGGPASPDVVLGKMEATMVKAAEYRRGAEGFEFAVLGEEFEKVAQAPSRDEELRDYLHLKQELEKLSFELGVRLSRYERAVDTLCKEAQRVVQGGGSITDVAQAISELSPNSSVTKLALKQLSAALGDTPAAHVKVAGVRELDVAHPLCTAFEKFATAALDYYSTAADADALRGILKEARTLLQ
jgi:hypothetical protein